MYPTTEWKDEIKDQSTGELIQEGTLQSAANFNNMEHGITDASLAATFLAVTTVHVKDAAVSKSEEFEAEFLNEVQTVTLTNTLSYPFNNSLKTVALAKSRKTLNYDVGVEVQSAKGNVGDISITDKQLNGFKIAFDGSATSVTVLLRIKGGMLV